MGFIAGRKIAAFVQQGRQEIHRDFEEPPDPDTIDAETDDADLQALQEVKQRLEDGEDPDEQLDGLIEGYKLEDGIPEWVADEETWQQAIDLVDPEEDGIDIFDEPWKAVAYLYVALGGEVLEEEDEDEDAKE